MTTHGVAPYPLYWPLDYPRAKYRSSARFQVDFSRSRAHLLRELDRLGARSVVLSTNIPIRKDGLPSVPNREPTDPGVAVYFERKGKPYVIACDQFSKVQWNLRAIGMTIEALRAIERNGASSMLERAFSGFAQLPASTGGARPWREVLGDGTIDVVRARYKALAYERHPDLGGSHEALLELNRAWEEAQRELAGGERA